MPKIIRTKERIKKTAEIFTPEWMVKDMCDMLEDEAPNAFALGKTFLEPSCGDGNFLVEILARKLQYCKSDADIINGLKDIYGVDLMPDNIAEAKRRMLAMIDGKYDIAEARRIIDINIQQGDFLKEQDKIVFTDWTDMSQHTLASMIKPDLFNSTKRKTNDRK